MPKTFIDWKCFNEFFSAVNLFSIPFRLNAFVVKRRKKIQKKKKNRNILSFVIWFFILQQKDLRPSIPTINKSTKILTKRRLNRSISRHPFLWSNQNKSSVKNAFFHENQIIYSHKKFIPFHPYIFWEKKIYISRTKKKQKKTIRDQKRIDKSNKRRHLFMR